MYSYDLFSISSFGYYFTVRLYADFNLGSRKLGKGRYALDLGKVSFLFEKY